MKFKSIRSEVFLVKRFLKICRKLICNFIEITLWHGCSPVTLLQILWTRFTKNTSGWLLLEIVKNYVKSDMNYSHLVAFIIFIIYLTLTLCFYFGLLAWLLRTIPLLRKLKNRLLGLNHVVFSEKKLRTRLLGLKYIVFFHDISSKWQWSSGKCCMSSIGKKFGNGLLSLNHASICNFSFTWVRSAEKIVQMPKTWFSIFTQTTSFKKTPWVGTVPLDNKCLMTSLKIKTLRRKKLLLIIK